MRYKCLEISLLSILMISKIGVTIEGLGAIFCFILAVSLIKLVSEAIEEVALSF